PIIESILLGSEVAIEILEPPAEAGIPQHGLDAATDYPSAVGIGVRIVDRIGSHERVEFRIQPAITGGGINQCVALSGRHANAATDRAKAIDTEFGGLRRISVLSRLAA